MKTIAAMALLSATSMTGLGFHMDPTLGRIDDDMEMGDFSLADLSDLDVSDVQEIRYESLPAGMYGFKVIASDLTETTNRDNEKRFVVELKLEIVEIKAVLKKIPEDKGGNESLIGKTHSEKFYIVPEKPEEGIGRIRASFVDMGAESKGKLGEIVAGIVDHTFYGKIVEQKDKDDKSKVYARLKLDPIKK